MRLRNTLILLGVAIALGLFIFVSERSVPSTDESKERERFAFPDFRGKQNKADAVEIARGATQIVLVKRDAGTSDERWQITQPIDFPADTSRIISLLGSFERAEKILMAEGQRSKALEPGDDLSQYGLLQEKATRVRVMAGDDTLLDAVVGGETAATGKVYAGPTDRSEVFVVADEVRENSAARVDELRDKRMLSLTRGLITHIAILKEGRPVVTVGRGEAKDWRVIDPLADRADRQKVDEIVNRLGSLWADAFKEDFAPDDNEMPKKLVEYGLKPAMLSVRATRMIADQPQQHEVLIGKRVKKTEGAVTSWDVYAMVAGTRSVVFLPESATVVFDVEPDDLRDPRAFSFETSEAERVTVKRGGGELFFRKKGKEWFLGSDGERGADSAQVREFLSELADVRAQKFLPFGTELSDPASVEVAWGGGESSRTETVYFELAQGDSVRARRGENGAILELPSSVARAVASPALRFWDRTVLKFKADVLSRLSITRSGTTESADRGSEGWDLEGGGKVNTGIADSMKWALSDLAADSFVEGSPEADSSKFGFDDPFIRIVMDTKPDDGDGDVKRIVLLVGRVEDDQAEAKRRFAAIEGGEAVFVLGEHVVAKFEKRLKKDEQD